MAYSVSEAAAALGVSPSHVRKMIRSGVIRAVRLGGRVLVPRVVLDEFGRER